MASKAEESVEVVDAFDQLPFPEEFIPKGVEQLLLPRAFRHHRQKHQGPD